MAGAGGERKLTLGERAAATAAAVVEARIKEESDKVVVPLFKAICGEIEAAAAKGLFRHDVQFSTWKVAKEMFQSVHVLSLSSMLTDEGICVQPDCPCESPENVICPHRSFTRWRCTWGPNKGPKASGLGYLRHKIGGGGIADP